MFLSESNQSIDVWLHGRTNGQSDRIVNEIIMKHMYKIILIAFTCYSARFGAAFRPTIDIMSSSTSTNENSHTRRLMQRAPFTLQATMKFKSFEEMLGELQKEPLLLVYFFKDLCGPCKLQRQELAAASQLLPARVLAIDVEKWPNIGTRHNIGKLPCLLVIQQGQEVERLEGLTTAGDLLERVSDLLRIAP